MHIHKLWASLWGTLVRVGFIYGVYFIVKCFRCGRALTHTHTHTHATPTPPTTRRSLGRFINTPSSECLYIYCWPHLLPAACVFVCLCAFEMKRAVVVYCVRYFVCLHSSNSNATELDSIYLLKPSQWKHMQSITRRKRPFFEANTRFTNPHGGLKHLALRHCVTRALRVVGSTISFMRHLANCCVHYTSRSHTNAHTHTQNHECVAAYFTGDAPAADPEAPYSIGDVWCLIRVTLRWIFVHLRVYDLPGIHPIL